MANKLQNAIQSVLTRETLLPFLFVNQIVQPCSTLSELPLIHRFSTKMAIESGKSMQNLQEYIKYSVEEFGRKSPSRAQDFHIFILLYLWLIFN